MTDRTIDSFAPTDALVDYMAAHNLRWAHHRQRFYASDWDYQAYVAFCPNGRWVAGYVQDSYGAVAYRSWESTYFSDPIACLLNAKLENWGN